MVQSKWIYKQEGTNMMATANSLGVHPLLVRIMANRGITSEEEMQTFLTKEDDVFEDIQGLINADKAVDMIRNIDGKVRIIGDYDVDGICASTILYKGLQALSYDVSVDIPDRIMDGYGLNINIINKAHEDGVQYIITCDNGIAAVESVAHANSLGMKVIVTDHHEVPIDMATGDEILPDAMVVVDPKLKDSTYRTREICGAYVAYKIIANLMDIANNAEYAELRDELLVLASFATYCDVMPLSGENRYLLRYGMKRFKNTKILGLNALIDIKGYSSKEIDSYSLGFVLGPCINATGRISDALKGVKLLTTKDPQEAVDIARELSNINDNRKTMTEAQTDIAIEMIENSNLKNDKIIIAVLSECHISICGLVAGRVKRKYNKPTIILAPSSKGLSGSARSIEEYNLFLNMSKYKDMFVAFGGHAMAAGLSMLPENVNAFREAINRDCTLTDDDMMAKKVVDACMEFNKVDLNLYNDLKKLEPYGNPNIKPNLACNDLLIKGISEFGKGRFINLKVMSPRDNTYCDLKIFSPKTEIIDYINARDGGDFNIRLTNKEDIKIDILYNVAYSDFNGPHAEVRVEEYK